MQTESREGFPVSSDAYWRELCLSLEYQERLYREALRCETMEVVKNEGDYATGVKRHLRFTQKSDAPAPVRKVFGETMTLEEISEFDPAQKRWTFRVIPAVMADRMDIRGDITLEGGAAGSVVQVARQTFSCKIFGIGGLVERFIAKSIEESQANKNRFTHAYIREKGL
jgi:hypothetical protein